MKVLTLRLLLLLLLRLLADCQHMEHAIHCSRCLASRLCGSRDVLHAMQVPHHCNTPPHIMLELGRSAAPLGKEGLYLWTTLLMILTALLAVLASTAQASMQDKVPRRSSLWQRGKLLLELMSQALTDLRYSSQWPLSRVLREEAG